MLFLKRLRAAWRILSDPKFGTAENRRWKNRWDPPPATELEWWGDGTARLVVDVSQLDEMQIRALQVEIADAREKVWLYGWQEVLG
jgi:hypothetical protein